VGDSKSMRRSLSYLLITLPALAAACVDIIGFPDVPAPVDASDAAVTSVADTSALDNAASTSLRDNENDSANDSRRDIDSGDAYTTDAFEAEAGSCMTGASRCSDLSTAQTCMAGMWGAPQMCANQACVDGGCIGVCSPRTSKCTSATEVAVCNTSGQWTASATCPNACVGLMGVVGGQCAVCNPGDRQCAPGNAVQTCGTDGQWGAAAACSMALPYCANGACSPSPPGDGGAPGDAADGG